MAINSVLLDWPLVLIVVLFATAVVFAVEPRLALWSAERFRRLWRKLKG